MTAKGGNEYMDDEGSTTNRTGARATAARKGTRPTVKGKKKVARKDTRPSVKGKKTAILVAGMHRSGTSALARTLSLLGCDLPKTLGNFGTGVSRPSYRAMTAALHPEEPRI